MNRRNGNRDRTVSKREHLISRVRLAWRPHWITWKRSDDRPSKNRTIILGDWLTKSFRLCPESESSAPRPTGRDLISFQLGTIHAHDLGGLC